MVAMGECGEIYKGLGGLQRRMSARYGEIGTISKRVVFEGNRAVGVELLAARPNPGQCEDAVTVHAGKEIVLTAGTIETPHILLLSGVGPTADLERYNIQVVKDLPGVGKNIQDHCAFSIEAVIDSNIPSQNQLLKDPEATAAAQKQYHETNTGPLAVYGASAATLRSNSRALRITRISSSTQRPPDVSSATPIVLAPSFGYMEARYSTKDQSHRQTP